MPQTIETTVYNFDELNDAAKEKARDWFREGYPDSDWWEATFEDANECARRLGITIDTRPNQGLCIFFTGFSSQGDGAHFEGVYAPVENAVDAIKGHAPIDEKLHAIAGLFDAANALAKGALTIKIGHKGHYEHAYTMTYDYAWTEAAYEEDGETPLFSNADMESAEEAFKEACIAFANWIYRQLESEHDYLLSNESVDENIRINEYTFTADGKRFG